MKQIIAILIIFISACFSVQAFDGEIVAEAEIAVAKSFISDSVAINLFAGEKWHGNTVSFSLYPRLMYKNKKVLIGFKEIIFGINSDYYSFNIGKKNLRYGMGYYSDIFSPMYPSDLTDDSTIWNGEILISLSFFEISIGVLCDTVSMEEYRTPLWLDTFALLKYQNESLELSFETDYFYSGNSVNVENYKLMNYKQTVDKHDLKSSFQLLYIFQDNYQVYLQTSIFYNGRYTHWTWNNVSVLVGLFKDFLFQNKYQLIPYIELGYGNRLFNSCIGISAILLHDIEIKFSALYVQDTTVFIKLDIKYETDNSIFETKLISPSLLQANMSPVVLTLKFAVKLHN